MSEASEWPTASETDVSRVSRVGPPVANPAWSQRRARAGGLGPSDAPEVVPQAYATLEVVPECAPEAVLDSEDKNNPDTLEMSGAAPEVVSPSPKANVEITAIASPEVEEEAPGKPWWKRWAWQLLIIGLVLLIGLLVGLIVGLVARNKDDTRSSASGDSSAETDSNVASTTSASTSTGTGTGEALPTAFARDFKSICPETICHQTLAAAPLNSRLHVFARGSDNDIRRRVWNGHGWETHDWESLKGNAGPMAGQPFTLAWTPGGTDQRVDLFTIESANMTLVGQHLGANGAASDQWETALRGPVRARPAMCAATNDRMDMFVVEGDGNTVQHSFWRNGASDIALATWDADIGTQKAATGVAVACRHGASQYDVVVYDRGDNSVKFKSYMGSGEKGGSWTDWTSRGGEFMGDPIAVSFDTDPDRFDFFGVGRDRQLYHFYRASADAEPTELEALGSSLASVPSVTSPAKGVLDLIATRTDGRVVHFRFDGTRWDDIWEDIGISSNSAPLAVNEGGRTTLMILGQENQLLVAEWETAADANWKDLAWNSWSSGGGDFATDFSALYNR